MCKSVFIKSTATLACVFFSLSCQGLSAQWNGKEKILEAVEKTFGDPPDMVRLDSKSRVWADKKNQRVVVDGYIALDAGQLEMLACLVGTKEHESVVACFTSAQVVHAGLLAVGAKKGEPVKWEPVYHPPTGSEIRVFALWKDAEGTKKSIDTREWVREVGTKDQILDVNYVFAGSGMWKDPDSGEERYLAEGGDLICVSNFSTATLDVPMRSSQVNSGRMFVAFTERIPERATPVRLVLQVVEPKRTADARDSTAPTSSSSESASEDRKVPAESDETPSFDNLSNPPKS